MASQHGLQMLHNQERVQMAGNQARGSLGKSNNLVYGKYAEEISNPNTHSGERERTLPRTDGDPHSWALESSPRQAEQ